MRSRNALFAVLAALCALGAAGAVVSAVVAQQDGSAVSSFRAPARPYLLYRTLDQRGGPARFGALESTSLAAPGATRRRSGRPCERLHASARTVLCVARAKSNRT